MNIETPNNETPEDLPELIDQPLPGTVNVPKNLHTVIKQQDLEELEKSSTTDKLTSLLNRHGFEKEITRIRNEIKYNRNEKEEKKEFALLLVDIDKFKSFNDTYGHDIGDLVLKCSADFFQKRFRINDIVSRWGGEEFVILLQDIEINKFFERLPVDEETKEHTLNFKLKITETDINGKKKYCIYTDDNVNMPLSPNEKVVVDQTISFSGGLVSFNPTEDDVEQKLKTADEHLYKAKEAGRNQIKFDSEQMVA